jgi:Flp pilus assembly protein TadG
VDIRNPSNAGRPVPAVRRRGGSVSFQLVVLMVPVFLGLIGFAVDLARLYSARADLQRAASAMALAAAGELGGTDVSTEYANTASRWAINATANPANKYDFGGNTIGDSTGTFASAEPVLTFYDAASAAIGAEGATGGEASGAAAKHVKVTVRGETPLVFWRFIPLAQEGRLNLVAEAVAGVSAPLCQACGIESIAVQAINQEDTTDFGFLPGSRYTLGYVCTGGPVPGALTNTLQRVPYVLLNRYNESAQVLAEENTQIYRIGALGLPPVTDPLMSCVRIGAEETIWVNAAPLACNQNRVNGQITAFLCGLAARFDSTVPAACNLINESDTIISQAGLDSDVTDLDDYAAYTGTGRRVITVPIVDTASTGTMIVLGFRQFLVEPAANDVTINAADANGRFAALYIGSVKPLRAGRMDGCTVTAGPGKVVLHQ